MTRNYRVFFEHVQVFFRASSPMHSEPGSDAFGSREARFSEFAAESTDRIQNFRRRGFRSAALKWRFGSIFDSKLDLLRNSLTAQQRRNQQRSIEAGSNARSSHKFAIYDDTLIYRNGSEVLEQMKG